MKQLFLACTLSIGLWGQQVHGQVSVSPAGPITLCSGNTVTLQLTGAGNRQIAWQRDNLPWGGNTANLIVTQTGQYRAIVSDTSGTMDSSNVVQVTTVARPIAQILGATTPINISQGISLTALSQPGCTYHWYRGNVLTFGGGPNFSQQLGSNSMLSAPGGPLIRSTFTLRLVVTNQAGCADTSASIVVNDYNRQTATVSGVTSGSCANQSMVFTATPTNPNVNLRWRRNGAIIPGATGLTYTTNLAGDYSVEVRPSHTITNPYTEYSNSFYYGGAPPPPVSFSINSLNGNTLCAANPSITLQIPTGIQYPGGVNPPGVASTWWKDGVPITTSWYTHSINVTTPGVYEVTLGNFSNGCGLRSNPITIQAQSALPLTIQPPVRNLLDCIPDTITLTAINTAGKQLQWYRNGQIIPNQTQPTLEVTSLGSYEVRSIHPICAETSNQVVVSFDSLRIALADTTLPKCVSDSVTLQVSLSNYPNAITTWYRNGMPIPSNSSTSLRTSLPGTYSFVVIISNCTIQSLPFLIPPYLSLAIQTTTNTLCYGGVVRLTAENTNGVSLDWYRDSSLIHQGTGTQLDVAFPGSYWISGQTNAECLETSVPIDIALRYPKPNLWISQDTLFSDAVPPIRWFKNGANWITTQRNFAVLRESARYHAHKYDSLQCWSPSSDTLSFFVANTESLASESPWRVYPNPSAGKLFVAGNEFREADFAIKLYNPLGQLVQTWLQPDLDGENRLQLNLLSFPDGIYLLRIENGPLISTQRVLIKK